jgi:hypothetical protein
VKAHLGRVRFRVAGVGTSGRAHRPDGVDERCVDLAVAIEVEGDRAAIIGCRRSADMGTSTSLRPFPPRNDSIICWVSPKRRAPSS